MSEGIIEEMAGEEIKLDEFGNHDIYSGLTTPPRKKSAAGTLPTISRIGSWCVYDSKRFCQETRCNDCIICENNK